MARFLANIGGIGALGLLALTTPASAQPYAADPGPSPYSQPPAVPTAEADLAAAQHTSEPPRSVCCVIPAGTMLAVQLVEPLSTHDTQSGAEFPLRLAAPVIVDGQVALPVGTRAVGRVVQSTGPGAGGKGGKLVVAAYYLVVNGGSVPLEGLQLTGVGKDQSTTADVASVGGLVFMPLGLIGFAVQGGDIKIPAGTAATVKIGRTITVPPIAVATRADYQAVDAMLGGAQPTSRGWIDVPPPPGGMGQIVFFRRPSLLGTAQWFNVREHGDALGKLTNGDYFVVPMTPGQHSFTATSEPEFKDRLTLQVDPGETYYVEGILTKGVLIGVADLTPSDKARFDKWSSELKPAPVPEPVVAAGPPAEPGPPRAP
jgi:hypothetical protein